MATLDQIRRVIKNASQKSYGKSLDSLRLGMNEIGYDFEDNDYGKIGAYEEARKMYWDVRSEEFDIEELNPKSWKWELTGTQLDLDGKKYFIHGVIHGGDGKFTRPMVNDFLQDEAKRLHKPEEGKVVFYENGFSEEIGSFGLKSGYDFKDRLVGTQKESDAFFKECFKMDQLLDKKRMDEYQDIASKCHTDYGFTQKAKESYKRLVDFEEPMRMEYDFMKYPMVSKVVGGRSKLMARKMFESDAKEVHAIVGLGHEDQISYFLRKMHKKSV